MTKRCKLSIVGDMFVAFGSAVAVSRAVEAGRRPSADDLRKLGIEPAAFQGIRRYY
jgi:hypothetical protein